MSRLLIQYDKLGPLAYLSHLEFMRSFERALRRAGIKVLRSQGFNPRPKISYGPALPVGMESEAEFLTIDIEEPICEAEFLVRVQSVMPQGIRLAKAKYIDSKAGSITASIQATEYVAKLRIHHDDTAHFDEAVMQLLSEKQLLVKRKDSEKWVETSQTILRLAIERVEDEFACTTLVMAVYPSGSVKPDAVLERLSDYVPHADYFQVVRIKRVAQYINRVSPFINIYDFYEGVTMGSECK